MTLRIGLVGAVQSTERALKAIIATDHTPVVVLTLPPDRSARHSDYVDLRPIAESAGSTVLDTPDVNDPQVLQQLSQLELDLVLVIGWSRICGPEFMAIPRLGTIGYHPALLPKMRGRAALGWTILLAPPETGGTLFWIDEGVDSGPIAVQERIALDGTETLRRLIDLQLDALERMLPPLLEQLERGERPARVQVHEQATYLALRRPEDGKIDWSQPAESIERLTRAVSRPYPGAFTFFRGNKVTIWSARVAAFPEWFALEGQVFMHEHGIPVVRCGRGTDLMLLDYEIENLPDLERSPFTGQPKLGR